MEQTQVKFKSSDEAFDFAIDCGRLSADPKASNYAGHYMYMGTYGGCDQFKHVNTRQYLTGAVSE